jgi:hypothetical protein
MLGNWSLNLSKTSEGSAQSSPITSSLRFPVMGSHSTNGSFHFSSTSATSRRISSFGAASPLLTAPRSFVPISSKHIEDQLSALRKQYTVVLVTHTLRQAKRLADYALFVYFGNLVEHGAADQFFTNPTDPRTKAYLQGIFG